MKKRKIIATVGPSSMNKHIIKKMDDSGVDMFRINLSHTKMEDFKFIVNTLQSWTDKPICPDTEGSQLRTTIIGKKIIVNNNDILEIVNHKKLKKQNQVGINSFDIRHLFKLGDLLKIDFDGVILNIIEINENVVIARILEGGIIGNNKGVGIDRDIQLPSFTKKDNKILSIAKELGLKDIFFSFCSNHEDIRLLRNKFDYNINVVSKIESRNGLLDLTNICIKSDAILIDRGDLSREVPLEKIPFAQSYIIKQAQKEKTPVYVATNLMENMIIKSKPTRAEINDVRSTLIEGVDGLVLAAESAIGAYPVECVRIMSRIIKEVDSNKKHTLKYLFSLPTDRMVEPHGGKLIQQHYKNINSENFIPTEKLVVNDKVFMDVFQIAEGTYSPIKSFMNIEEVKSVLNRNKLLNDELWTLPIIFQIDKDVVSNIPNKGEILLLRENDNKPFAILKIKLIEKIKEKNNLAKLWFGTDNKDHPGVANLLANGNYILSGRPYFLTNYKYLDRVKYTLTPKQTRDIFDHKGWHKIIGFHTRNVIHRGHEYIQIKSLEKYNADAIFLSPVAGIKKPGDFKADVILRCYDELIKSKMYNPFGVLLGSFNTYSRFSGPREAVFTAICRKNFGCSHFIVGRDHTGVSNYYSKTSSQKIFEKINLGIEIISTDEIVYDIEENRYISKIGNEKNTSRLKELSGSSIRDLLLENEDLPEYLIRPDIAEILKDLIRKTPDLLFEK